MFKCVKKQNIDLKKGFSLVEMLVAVGIFMSIMTIAISSLISIIAANKKAQSIKSTIDGVTFAVENISNDMRLGTDYKCLSSDNTALASCSSGNTAVGYINGSGATVIYRFNGKKINPQPGDPGILTRTINGIPDDLISQDSNVNITNMTFYVLGASDELNPVMANKTQPRVVITASGLIQVKGSSDTLFNLQTSISQGLRK